MCSRPTLIGPATPTRTEAITYRYTPLLQVMLACFICFTLRAFMLAALVQVQAEGQEDRKPGMGWKK